MPSLEQLLLWIAVGSTVLFCGKLALTLLGHYGIDCDIEHDADLADGIDAGFKLFSVQSLLAFGMGFGWLAVALRQQPDTSLSRAIALGALNGAAMLLLSAFLMRVLHRLNSASADHRPQVGDRARTYTTIPAGRRDSGLVQVFDQNTQQARQFTGVTDAVQDIASHRDVVVVEVVSNTVVVREASSATQS